MKKRIMEMFEFLDMKIDKILCFTSVILETDNFESFSQKFNQRDQSLYKFAIRNIVEDIILLKQGFGFIAETKPSQIAIIVGLTDPTDKEEWVFKLFQEVSVKIAEILPLTVTIGVGNFYNSMSEVSSSFNEALEATRYRIILGKNQVIMYRNIAIPTELEYAYPIEQEEKLRNILKIGNLYQIKTVLNDIIDDITRSYVISSNNIKQIFFHIINAIIKSIYETGYDIKDIFENQYDLYSYLESLETIHEIRIWLEDVCTRVGEFINSKREDKNKQIVDSILDFITNNYDKDITLDILSENILYSSTYLNKILKNYCGKTFYELLTDRRMNAARQLLLENEFQINVIAEKTGYNNVQSFIRMFKKVEGITPGQYREHHMVKQLNSELL